MLGYSTNTPYNYPLIFEGMMNLSSIWKTLVYVNYNEGHSANCGIYSSASFKIFSYVSNTYKSNVDSLLNSGN